MYIRIYMSIRRCTCIAFPKFGEDDLVIYCVREWICIRKSWLCMCIYVYFSKHMYSINWCIVCIKTVCVYVFIKSVYVNVLTNSVRVKYVHIQCVSKCTHECGGIHTAHCAQKMRTVWLQLSLCTYTDTGRQFYGVHSNIRAPEHNWRFWVPS